MNENTIEHAYKAGTIIILHSLPEISLALVKCIFLFCVSYLLNCLSN